MRRKFGVSITTVKNWASSPHWPGLPATPEQIDAFLIQIRSPFASIKPTAPDDRNRPSDPDYRWRLAKAELAEIELAQKKQELVKTADAAAELAAMATEIKAALTSLPRAIADRLVGLESPRDAEAILASEIENILLRLSGMAPAKDRKSSKPLGEKRSRRQKN